jgi:hypothetical protein
VDADISILDSGIDLTQPDLNVYHQKSYVNSNMDISALFGIGSAIAPTANGDNGHGMHITGIIAAKDNEIG